MSDHLPPGTPVATLRLPVPVSGLGSFVKTLERLHGKGMTFGPTEGPDDSKWLQFFTAEPDPRKASE